MHILKPFHFGGYRDFSYQLLVKHVWYTWYVSVYFNNISTLLTQNRKQKNWSQSLSFLLVCYLGLFSVCIEENQNVQ